MEVMKEFVKKYSNVFAIFILFIVCVLVYFWGIGAYPLMDVDETRYVSIAKHMFLSKDYSTLYLNGEYFFEKPPLYFWSECLSFGLFGKINEFTARFPCALYALLLTFGVYFTGKKIVSLKFGLISALVLATSLEFTMLARYAILDIVVTSLIGLSVLSGFLTQFVQDKNKKYFWWLFYIFSGLAVLAKGIPGFVIPFGVMFFVSIFNKTFKQCFRPINMIPGIILFLLMDRDSYGYEISKSIKQMSPDKYVIKETTLYSAFTRMEKNGYVRSYSKIAENGKRRSPLGAHFAL